MSIAKSKKESQREHARLAEYAAKARTLEDVYSRLNGKTPLNRDCGLLCAAACCKGDDGTGMLLFPGEEHLLAHSGIELLRLERGGAPRFLAVCGGVCERRLRPLSCRIFPLFPYVYEENGEMKLRVVYDPRALGVCPLARAGVRLSPAFVRNVGLCAKLLLRHPDCRSFLLEQSREIDDLIALNTALGGK